MHKKSLYTDRNIIKELKEIEKIIKSNESSDVKFESIKAIFHELADEISKAKLMGLMETLTGFWGPKAIQDYILKEIERSKRSGKYFCVAFIDIDFLKYINDNFGHVSGTKIILEVSKVIKSKIRKSDVASRYGGDEFLLLFPNTDLEKANIIVQRIKKGCEKIIVNGKIKVSVSEGVSQFDSKISKIEDILEAADKVLYDSKKKRININDTKSH